MLRTVSDEHEARPADVIDMRPASVVVTYDFHACRWCGASDCQTPADHDTLLRTSETYNRQSVKTRNECPRCGEDVRFGSQCSAVERQWVAA